MDKAFGDIAQMVKPKPLRPATEAMLIQLTQQKSADLVRLCVDKSLTRLTFVKEKRGVSLYEGRNERNHYMVKAETTVEAPIDDILASFNMGSTSEFDTTLRKLFALYANRGATLAYVSGQPISVHWMSLNTDKMETRDFAFASFAQLYEQTTTGALVPMDSRSSGTVAAGSLVWESVDLSKEMSILRQKETGCTRYLLRTCGFYVEPTNDVDVSRVSFVLQLENENGHVGGSKWMHHLAMSVGNLSRAMRKIELVPKHLWRESEHCVMCRKTFRGLLRRRHHCRLCGSSVCSDCSKTLELDTPVAESGSTVTVSSVRACTKCYDSTEGSGSVRSNSNRSSSDYSHRTSFEEPRSTNLSRTMSKNSVMSTDTIDSMRQTASTGAGTTFSAAQLQSLDDLMAQSNPSGIDRESTSSSMFFVIPNDHDAAQPTLSSRSIVHEVSETGVFDVSSMGAVLPPRRGPSGAPLAPPSLSSSSVSSTTSSKLNMRGDMILLE
ncbi:Aste57867_11848 [Aphanomyces stellatus]|uniref:Aste57867_11848 protein n=1 Tax=Aphanomyces stellatus TaxID=120398 RepID=A0A485KV91_9STRA|nr:hypothetical protein As57867_011803 [Aphanomyces stellatus]VFT88703.1 Aste57867_11848 [Aphanomyces stellatus]